MTDRELLNLAAKAYNSGNDAWQCADYQRGFIGNWNPLDDDGDALRLAVKLELDLSLGLCGGIVYMRRGARIEEFSDEDPYAATRRAIVRAAAAIGEKL